MKKLILLHALLAMIFSCTPLCGMLTKITTKLKNAAKQIQWKTQETVYIPSVLLTDSVMLLGSGIAHGYCKLSKNPISHKESIKNQLTIIKNDLEEDKKNIIKDLAKDYNITDKQLEKITSRIKIYKNCGTEWISHRQWPAQFPKHHDKDFPLKEAFPLLEKNNIDPDAIWLIKSQLPHENKVLATGAALSFQHYQNHDSESDYYYIKGDIDSPPIITLYPFIRHNKWFFDTFLFSTSRRSTLIHEIGHAVEHHSLEQSIISSAIHHLTKAKYKDIYSNENYKRLQQQHEREAEILPALKFKEDASTLRRARRWGLYPKMLYSEHYLTLALVDTLHKLNDKLPE